MGDYDDRREEMTVTMSRGQLSRTFAQRIIPLQEIIVSVNLPYPYTHLLLIHSDYYYREDYRAGV